MSGYFIIARSIFESPIWRDNPSHLKLFIYLIGKARWQEEPKRYPWGELKRGEVITSLSIIREDNEYDFKKGKSFWHKQTIQRMLLKLEEQGYIKLYCDTYGTYLSICNYDKYQDVETYIVTASAREVLAGCTRGAFGVDTIKKDKQDKKGKNKEKIIPAEHQTNIPEWMPLEAWNGFIEMRKKSKTPFTERAIKLAISELERLKGDGQDVGAVLNQSVMNGWKGLFPIKQSGKNVPSQMDKTLSALERAREIVEGREDKKALGGGYGI